MTKSQRLKEFGQNHPEVVAYAEKLLQPEDSVLRKIRDNSQAGGLPGIQVGPFDGLHLEVLTRMAGARKSVEIGTLGGYSAVCICRGMGPGGLLHSFELDPHRANLALQNLELAQTLCDVRVHVGPALDNLNKISKDAPFDLVFIDADKVNYAGYLRWAVDHIRVGGVILADNTFAWGAIHSPLNPNGEENKEVVGLRKYNQAAVEDPRLRTTILPTAEGLTVSVKIH